MLTTSLLAAIVGLAALDSLNPATIAGVALILVAPLNRPVATALAYVAGAYTLVLTVGVSLFIGVGALGQWVGDASRWVRRGAFLMAALMIAAAGLRRLSSRTRPAVVLPAWFGPRTAAPLGVLATAADIPNAFPYFLAIERLTASAVPVDQGIAVLASYSLIYCLPCLLLLIAGIIWRGRVTQRLHRVYERFGRARRVQRSVSKATAMMAAALALAAIAFTA